MTNPNINFRGQVLNRVYRVWLSRKFLPVFLSEVIILSVVLYKLSRLVFVEKFLENFFRILFQNPYGSLTFLYSAFGRTATTTKILTAVLVILLALLLRGITQGILRFILVRKNYFGKVNGN